MATGSLGPGVEAGQDVVFTLDRGYRGPFLRRSVSMLVVAALCGFVAANTAPVVWGVAGAIAALGLFNLTKYLWSMRFRTRLRPEGIEVRGYFNHFVSWSDITGIDTKDYQLPRQGALDPPYVTPDGSVNRGYDSVRSMGLQGRRRPSSTGGVRAKLNTVRITQPRGRQLMLRAPLVTDWQSDPEFQDKVRLIRQWWETYAQAAAQRAGQGR
jgi:hypothetical protein